MKTFTHHKIYYLLLFVFCLSFQSPISPQQFEGTITFKKESEADTVYYGYHVKNHIVRIDEYDNSKNLLKYYLVDLTSESVKVIHPEKKMYRSLPVRDYIEPSDDTFQIIKSKNSKTINGYKCYQWRVRNTVQNTEVAYWVANEDFRFFDEVLKILNRADKHTYFYLQIPEKDGFFPILTVERSLLRIERVSLKVTDIEKKLLDSSMFEIPNNYFGIDL